MPEYQFLKYETHDEGRVVRILLNRPEVRNAQNRGMLVELDEAFLSAEADDRVRVVIFGGNGSMFSSGHDMGTAVSIAERTHGDPGEHPISMAYGGTLLGLENRYRQ